MKRTFNAESFRIEFKDKEGVQLMNVPRKLKILFLLHVFKMGKVNKKALLRELDKYTRMVKSA